MTGACFLVEIFQKMPKNAHFGLFFKKIACGAEKLVNIGSLKCFGRAQKINLFDLKKVEKVFKTSNHKKFSTAFLS